ncbi:ATP-binding protein [Streptomyces sp. SID8379]|uniref:ATP-binding protein n=1 Tax=unclassified Streptomyces TaxID=2593676 RepID=UPI0004771FD8|nr:MULTISPECIES: ATP-binding protein [unclassified Streptomyces]MYW67641.1 ATP-binding protein [Streptomyces sp. SID8379]
MDPMNRGPEDFSQDRRDDSTGGRGGRQRPPRDPLTPDFGQPSPALARTSQLVSGDYLLTVNPVDGSEIEPCPPGERPGRPVKYDAQERIELARATRPPLPPGPALPRLPLLERQEDRERLVRLLARGRSVRLTGPSGSGRTALLDQVAEDCLDIAPDGVVRLSGHRRSADDLLHDLFGAVYNAPLHRPDRALLLELVHEVGAVVVLDDLEFGGAQLDELLEATPECAFLLAATPDVAAPSADSHVEEVFLGGLGRGSSLELLERAVGRVLTDEEAQWAGDLWFESEGLPLRFAQAGALLRQRDQLRADPDTFDAFGYYEGPGAAPVDAPFDSDDGHDVPLPSLAEGAAPAALLASRLSGSARATLRFAVTLGGEIPHQAHLPALVGDQHADAALAELVSCALVTTVGGRYRLATGVQVQLEAAGYGDDTVERADTAARHYAWWAGHPSVGPERVAAEGDALLAALLALVPSTTPVPAEEEPPASVELARAAAPAFAAGLAWSAWERALRSGQEAARLAGLVHEEAYFHHELGILALLGGQLDRARAELEASIGLRGALADKRGTIAGRRALALVADRSGGALPGGRTAAGEEVPDAMYEESQSPPGGVPAAYAQPEPPREPDASLTRQVPPTPAPPAPTVIGGGAAPSRKSVVTGTRRNLVAAGAGALLAAVLGTVVTLGATSNNDQPPSDKVNTNPSATAGESGGDLGADKADQGGDKGGDDSASTAEPTDPGKDGIPGTADDPTPSSGGTDEPSDEPSGTKSPDDPTKSPTKKPTKSPTKSPTKPPTKSPTPSDDPTSPDPTDEPTTPDPTDPTDDPTTPDTSDTASRPVTTAPVTSTDAGTPSGSGSVM